MEEPEIAALGGVGTPGIVQADLVEQGQVAEQRIIVRRGEVVGRRGYKEYLGALLVYRSIDLDAGKFFQFVNGKIDTILETVRQDTEMIAGAEAIGRRRTDPFDTEADKVHQLPGHHRDLGGVDAVRAEDRTATTLGALVKIVEPFLEHPHRQFASTGDTAEDLTRGGEIIAVNRAQKLRPEYGHIFRIAAADEKVALVGTGAAAHANIHEHSQ